VGVCGARSTQHTQGKVHTCMYLGRVDLCKKYCCCFLSGYPRYFCCFFRLPGCTHDTPGEHTRTQLLLGRRRKTFQASSCLPVSFLYITHTQEENCGTTYSYLCVLVCMYDVPYYLFTFKPCTHAWYPVAGRRYCTFFTLLVLVRDDVDTTLIGTTVASYTTTTLQAKPPCTRKRYRHVYSSLP
jgi:hypothetical protein